MKEVLLFAINNLRKAGSLASLPPAKVPGLRQDEQEIQLWDFGLQVPAAVPGTSDRGNILPGPFVTLQRGVGGVTHSSSDLPVQVKDSQGVNQS